MNHDAIIQELATQRMLMGDRACQLASDLAEAKQQIEQLAKYIAEMQKKQATQS